MFSFLNKLTYFILSLQEKTLMKRLRRKLKSSSDSSRRRFSNIASFELKTKAEQNKVKLENNVKSILSKYENNPKKLLKFIEKNGTKVYRIVFADKILNLIGCEEGFVQKTKGLKAFYLNIVVSVFAGEKFRFSFLTQPMFILRNLPVDPYYMIQQFHKWYAMKKDLPGFDAQAQENFQKFLNQNKDEKIKDLSVDEILGLKDAIQRDVEAINFVVELAKSTIGSKKALQKMKTGGASV